ncbi:hypothetical protein CMUS01_04420 [Colletotrichum musicola]|uniref:RNA-dependent RNA polymerase n=1 Tax=Colletotrichum musicola TaxID=2175873 RepID=A0A8H6KWH8_9PEZI|nr:hypothetical protein CMUS01_04420 [Colletotrichum musicola]
MAPSSLKSYRVVVQDFVSLDDKQWVYCLSSFPSASQANTVGLVKSITLATNDCRHQIELSFQLVSPNRATSSYPLDQFLAISFAGFRPLYNQSTETVGTQPSTPRECTDYTIRLLRSSVCINGILYKFFGHSNSQLKSRTSLLFAASKEEIKKVVDAMGDFDKMKTVQKKAKRIGLLFSTAHAVLPVDPSRCHDIPDIETPDYVFMDGCGLIAPHLARDLARRMRIAFRNVRYTPLVFQIRYRGYKGVVTLDPSMKGGETLLKLRKSMRKFTGGTDYGFSVVEYSKNNTGQPYGFGHLNDEVIILLHSLGVTSEILLRKQQEHFSFLASAVADPRAAFRFLTYVNQYDLAERVLLESLENVKPQAAEYPAAKESISFKPFADDDRLVYFARYTNASLGRVKNLYLSWAASFGLMSPECQELNRLFSTCVDGNRIKIPPRLESPPEPSPNAPPFVLSHLHDTAKAFARSREHHLISSELSCDGYNFDAMEMLICRGDLAASEFELLQFTYRWCLSNGASLGEFAHFFDFALLSAGEKTWALAHMPVSSDYPSLVRNALCQSDLLQESELSDFKLNHPCLRWKPFYASSRDRPASFLEKAATALHLFHRKLILLQVDDRLTIAIYIPQQVQPAKDYRIGDRARLFAFPRSRDKQTSSRLSLPTKAN